MTTPTYPRVNIHEGVVFEPQVEDIMLFDILFIESLGRVEPPARKEGGGEGRGVDGTKAVELGSRSHLYKYP
jgi:hypothetical protein